MKNKKKWIRYIGILLAMVIVWFMVSEFIENWHAIKPYLANMNPWVLLVAIGLYAVAFLATGYNWSAILWKMDSTLSKVDYLDIHMVSALARYIPGGIWSIVGKAYLCNQKNVDKKATTVSMILEYVFQIVSSGLFLLFFFPVLLRKVLTPVTGGLIFIGFLVVIALLPWGIRFGSKILSKILKENKNDVVLENKFIYKVLIKYMAVWLLTGLGLIVLVLAFTEIERLQGIFLVLSYPISWVAGFLSPSPNGMGVREGVLSILLGDGYSYELILLITLTTRIWTILGEIVAFVGFKIVYRFMYQVHLRKPYDDVRKKKVYLVHNALFITSKNLDYLRNTQEIEFLKEEYDNVTIIGSYSKSYPKRLMHVYIRLLLTSMKKFDMIFVGFSPQLILPFFKWKFKGKPITIDFFISLYDTLIFDRRKFKQDSFIAKSLKKLDMVTLKAADRVIADTKAHGKYFVEELGLDEKLLQVMYLKADTSIYTPRKVEKPKEMKDKFVVLYFGSVLPLQGVDIVLESAGILKSEKDTYFYIIGPIKETYQKPESQYISYINWLSQEELADYIGFSDLCLAGHFNKSIKKAKRTIPGKAYIYEAMKKPMILGDNPANRELYAEDQEGIYFVEMGNSKALADEILKIKESTYETNYSNTVL